MTVDSEKSGPDNMAISAEAIDKIPTTTSPDDSEDEVAPEAIGTGNLPPGYYRSAHFIGTMVGVTLMNVSLYVGYVLPVCLAKYFKFPETTADLSS